MFEAVEVSVVAPALASNLTVLSELRVADV